MSAERQVQRVETEIADWDTRSAVWRVAAKAIRAALAGPATGEVMSKIIHEIGAPLRDKLAHDDDGD